MRLTTCGRVVAFMLAVASGTACAGSGFIYKCQNPNGKVIYSDLPCDVNDSKGVKRLEADAAGRRLRESTYHPTVPVSPPPQQEVRREEPKRDVLPNVPVSQAAPIAEPPETHHAELDEAEAERIGSSLIQKGAAFMIGSA